MPRRRGHQGEPPVLTFPTTAWAVLLLGGLTLTIVAALRLEKPGLQPWALLRAAVQLAALSLLLSGIITSPVLTVLFLAAMVLAATFIVYRRLRLPPIRLPTVALIVAASAAVPAALVFTSGAVEFSPRYLLAVGGIVVGNSMTVCTLMGRGLSSAVLTNRDEAEGWLALGATPRRAVLRLVRAAASTALIPSTDQTRTTGLVTLPGAFVGAVFAGASPGQAAQFQMVVLAAILAAGAIAVLGCSWAFGAPRVLPLDDSGLRRTTGDRSVDRRRGQPPT